MSKHLQRDLDHLKDELLAMGSMVESAINKAIVALIERNVELAEEVLEGDTQINLKENQIEEECLKILALHQPVAADLRFIIVALKVNNDLERIADLATNIAERSTYLSTHEDLDATLDFSKMTEDVRDMVQGSLDSLVDQDTTLAQSVLSKDDEVDSINRKMFQTLQIHMKDKPETVERAVQLLSVSRYLERIADLATNIAEDVIFMVDGELIRHHFTSHHKEES